MENPEFLQEKYGLHKSPEAELAAERSEARTGESGTSTTETTLVDRDAEIKKKKEYDARTTTQKSEDEARIGEIKKELKISETQESEHDYKYFTDPAEREFLLAVADNFIEQVRANEQPYDSFVYFDRSARLFGHLIRERWRHLFPNEPIPETYFVKIGREMGHPSHGDDDPFYYKYPWKSIFQKNMFQKKPDLPEIFSRIKENIDYKKRVKSLRHSFSDGRNKTFDEKRVLLVDEFMASGRTLSYGKKLFTDAFPSAHIKGAALVSRSRIDSSEPKYNNYEDYNLPTSIRPIYGSQIPESLGDQYNSGVKIPRPPSEEHADSFFIKPVFANQFEEHIKSIERDIALTEERVKKIPEEKRRVKMESRRGSWGWEDHPANQMGMNPRASSGLFFRSKLRGIKPMTRPP